MADYLSDEEQVAALRKWWEENGTFLIVALLILGGGLFSWRWYQDYSRTQQEGASKIYEEYLEIRSGLASDGDAKARQAKLLAQLDDKYSNSSYETFTLFYRAVDALERGNEDEAEQLLRQALKQAPNDEMKDLSRIRLSRLLFDREKNDEALVLLSGVTSAGYLSQAAELKGDILAAQGENAEAQAAYLLALEEKSENEERPILEMKLSNLASVNEATP